MDHAVLTELAAGAALDDLDPRERAALDAHLASCGRCQALVVELEEVLADLALAAPELQPPASLRGDLLDRLREPDAVDRAARCSLRRRRPIARGHASRPGHRWPWPPVWPSSPSASRPHHPAR